MVVIRVFLLVFIVSFSLRSHAEDWEFKYSNMNKFSQELDAIIGVNYLFNCELIVEKIEVNENLTYWITITDQVTGNQSVLDFKILKKNQLRESLNGSFLLFKRSGTLDNQKVVSLNIRKSFDGAWVEITYQEYFTKPFYVTNIVKCSAE